MFAMHQHAVSAASIKNADQSVEMFLKLNIYVPRGTWTRMEIL
jgi:hypothetical protein